MSKLICKAHFYDGRRDEGGRSKPWEKGEEYTGNNPETIKNETLVGPPEAPKAAQEETKAAPEATVEPEGEKEADESAEGAPEGSGEASIEDAEPEVKEAPKAAETRRRRNRG